MNWSWRSPTGTGRGKTFCPEQETAEIERAAGLLKKAGLKGQRLQVAAAFHSPLVAAAAEPVGEGVGRGCLGGGAVSRPCEHHGRAVSRSARGRPPATGAATRGAGGLLENSGDPLRGGSAELRGIGPGRRLSGLAAILSGRDVLTVAVDASSGKNHGSLLDLALALAQLAARGHAIDLTRWDAGALEAFELGQKRKKPLLTVA